jgi:prepilin-type N-terminal cleavage/methylation domain-containing protein
MAPKTKLSNNNNGFTILELIIATAIFSGALLMLMLGFLSISNSYTKGLTVTETQNVSRNVINTISQSLEFGNSIANQLPTPEAASNGTQSGWFCTDNYVFAYTLGQEVSTVNGTKQDALEQVPDITCPVANVSGCPNQGTTLPSADSCAKSSGAVELLGPRMRLIALAIAQGPEGSYQIDTGVAYGDAQFLKGVVVSGVTQYYDTPLSKVTCTGTTADNFCATSELQTVVGPRIDN